MPMTRNVIVGAVVLFAGCAPQAGEACDSGETACSGGELLTCDDGEWSVDENCTCDGIVTSCAIPGFTGVGRKRGGRV